MWRSRCGKGTSIFSFPSSSETARFSSLSTLGDSSIRTQTRSVQSSELAPNDWKNASGPGPGRTPGVRRAAARSAWAVVSSGEP